MDALQHVQGTVPFRPGPGQINCLFVYRSQLFRVVLRLASFRDRKGAELAASSRTFLGTGIQPPLSRKTRARECREEPRPGEKHPPNYRRLWPECRWELVEPV